jgi:hypothetical protein
MEVQRPQVVKDILSKRVMVVSKYLTSNYTTKPQKPNLAWYQHKNGHVD